MIQLLFLSHPFLVFIGKMSYSLYLWHWGLLVFVTILFGSNPLYYLAVFPLLFVVSFVSYVFIENRFRYFTHTYGFVAFLRLPPLIFSLLSYIFLLLLTGFLVIVLGLNKKSFYALLGPDTGYQSIVQRDSNLNTCSNKPLGLDLYKPFDSGRKIFLVGNSHAVNYLPSLSNVAEDFGFSLPILCVGETSLANEFPSALKQISQVAGKDDIIFYTRQSFFSTDDMDSSRLSINKVDPGMSYDQLLSLHRETISDIHRLRNIATSVGASLVLINDLPRLSYPEYFSASRRFYPDINFSISIEQASLRRRGLSKLINSFSKFSNVYVLDPFFYVCRDNRCSPFDDNNNLMFGDPSPHLNPYGVAYFDKFFIDFFEQL